MTIQLTQAVRIAGVVQSAGTQLTLTAALERELVTANQATYVGAFPSFPGRPTLHNVLYPSGDTTYVRDSANINAAIAAINAAGGGTLQLVDGIYYAEEILLLPGVSIVGARPVLKYLSPQQDFYDVTGGTRILGGGNKVGFYGNIGAGDATTTPSANDGSYHTPYGNGAIYRDFSLEGHACAWWDSCRNGKGMCHTEIINIHIMDTTANNIDTWIAANNLNLFGETKPPAVMWANFHRLEVKGFSVQKCASGMRLINSSTYCQWGNSSFDELNIWTNGSYYTTSIYDKTVLSIEIDPDVYDSVTGNKCSGFNALEFGRVQIMLGSLATSQYGYVRVIGSYGKSGSSVNTNINFTGGLDLEGGGPPIEGVIYDTCNAATHYNVGVLSMSSYSFTTTSNPGITLATSGARIQNKNSASLSAFRAENGDFEFYGYLSAMKAQPYLTICDFMEGDFASNYANQSTVASFILTGNRFWGGSITATFAGITGTAAVDLNGSTKTVTAGFIPAWSGAVSYPKNAYVTSGGLVYKAVRANTNVTPGTSNSDWYTVNISTNTNMASFPYTWSGKKIFHPGVVSSTRTNDSDSTGLLTTFKGIFHAVNDSGANTLSFGGGLSGRLSMSNSGFLKGFLSSNASGGISELDLLRSIKLWTGAGTLLPGINIVESASPVTMTLPTIAYAQNSTGNQGMHIVVINIGAGAVTVQRGSTDTIEGATTDTITGGAYHKAEYFCCIRTDAVTKFWLKGYAA